MTQNQLQYWRNVETERSNRAQEEIALWRAAIEQGALDHRIDAFFKQLDFDKSKWQEQLDLEWFKAQWDAFSKATRGVKDLTGVVAGWVLPGGRQNETPGGPTQALPGVAPIVIPESIPKPTPHRDPNEEPIPQNQEEKGSGWVPTPIPQPAPAFVSPGNSSAGTWAPSVGAAATGLAALGFAFALGGGGSVNPFKKMDNYGLVFADIR